MLCLVLLLGPVFMLGCGTYTCDIFNCNTLFLLEDWVEAQGQTTDADGEDANHTDEPTEGHDPDAVEQADDDADEDHDDEDEHLGEE